MSVPLTALSSNSRLTGLDDGYRLGYSGHDYLALKAFSKKGVIYAVGPQVGTGKESDVFTCTGDDESGKKLILKIHRYFCRHENDC
jgi:RIO-like serine/threonine protein kinase